VDVNRKYVVVVKGKITKKKIHELLKELEEFEETKISDKKINDDC
jgi:hypothetical protein